MKQPDMTIAEIIAAANALSEHEVYRHMTYTDIAQLGHIMDRLRESKTNE